jgi:hypothetical protein
MSHVRQSSARGSVTLLAPLGHSHMQVEVYFTTLRIFFVGRFSTFYAGLCSSRFMISPLPSESLFSQTLSHFSFLIPPYIYLFLLLIRILIGILGKDSFGFHNDTGRGLNSIASPSIAIFFDNPRKHGPNSIPKGTGIIQGSCQW